MNSSKLGGALKKTGKTNPEGMKSGSRGGCFYREHDALG